MDKKKWVSYAVVGLLAVLIHWGILYIAYVVWQSAGGQETGNFFSAIYDRFVQAGDIPHYVDIAKNWYHASGENANNIVFFPLYPMLMKCFYFLFRDYVIAGVVVSNLCLMAGTVYLFRLLEEEYDRERAWEGVIVLSLFPVGFFMVGAYTESLFIMLTVMCLYYIRRERWLLVGVLGMLAALSRSQGIVLLAPAVYEVCLLLRQKKRSFSMLSLLLIPAGTLSYLILNHVIYGKWNAFLDFQAAEPWYNTSHWISENLSQHYSMGLQYPYLGVYIYWAQLLLYFAGIALLFYGLWKKVRTSYIVLGGAYMFVTFLHGWMISGPRYMMSCVTIYIILAAPEEKGMKRAVLLLFGILSVFFGMWYLQGQAIM